MTGRLSKLDTRLLKTFSDSHEKGRHVAARTWLPRQSGQTSSEAFYGAISDFKSGCVIALVNVIPSHESPSLCLSCLISNRYQRVCASMDFPRLGKSSDFPKVDMRGGIAQEESR